MITFLTIARVLYDKGFKELTECARYLKNSHKDVEFQWLGGIDYGYSQHVKEEDINLLQEQGIIRYFGFHSDVKSYIQNADCIVLPSYHEGMSRVLMEALAMRKPIITTNISGCKEMVINGENGFLCEPRDSTSLINAVNKFLNLDQDQRLYMGNISRKYAEKRFNIKNVIEVYDNIIKAITK